MDVEEKIDIFNFISWPKIELKDTQVDILIALSDNKGYALCELKEMIESTESYLCDMLGELSSYEFGDLDDCTSIQSCHLKDPLSLFHKIQDQRDAVSKYLFKNMPRFSKKKSSNLNPYMVGFYLARDLNNLLCDIDLYSNERFSNVKLSPEAKKLIALKEKIKHKRSIRILNRILIEDTYPDEICKGRFSLIHKSFRGRSDKPGDPYFINQDLRTFNFIAEYLKFKIKLDRSELEVLMTRFKYYIRVLGKNKNIIDCTDIEKSIKNGKYDIAYYKNRYERNISILWKFMISNYVIELIKKYGYNEQTMILELLSNEFDQTKFMGVLLKKGVFRQ